MKMTQPKLLFIAFVVLSVFFVVHAQNYESVPAATSLSGYSSEATIQSALTLRNAGSQPLSITAVNLGDSVNDAWIATSFTANSQVPGFAGTLAGTVTATVTDLAVGTHTGSIVFSFVDDNPAPASHTVTVTIRAGFDILFNGAHSASRWADVDEVVNVSEGDSFESQWRLRSKPNADVMFDFTGDNTDSGITISPAQIIFTPSNWNVYIPVTITSTQNANAEGDRDVELGVAITTTDPDFGALVLPKYTISIKDNDTPGIFVTQSTFALTEGGAGVTFSVNLQTAPTDDVVITFAAHQQFTITPATFTFTDVTPQELTIIATADNVVEGTMVLSRVLGTVTTTDTDYSGFTLPTATITITDDDLLVLAITPSTGPEDGETEVLVHLSGAVTLDTTSISYSGFTFVNFQENPTHVWAGPASDEFVRDLQCIWGSHSGAPATAALVQGPRTVKCVSPSCSANTLDTFKRCFSSVDIRLQANNQIAPSPYPQFYYYWSPQHDVITPENRDDEVWRSTILGISPTTGPMHLETEITITGSHFAVDTHRREVAPSITQAEPAVRMDGYLCRGTRWVDENDHDKGIISYTPKRKDLEGTSKTKSVKFTISFNNQQFWGDNSFTFGYQDEIRAKTSLAWTVFFVVVNGAFLIFFMYTLKGWLCQNFCQRCQKDDDTEDEGDLDIQGPKLVSEYLEKKILERLTRDRDVLRAYRQAAEDDAQLKSKLDDAGYADAWEDEDEVAARKEEEALAKAAEAKLARVAGERNVLGKKGSMITLENNVVEMTPLRENNLAVVPSMDDRNQRMAAFEIESSPVRPKAAPSSNAALHRRR